MIPISGTGQPREGRTCASSGTRSAQSPSAASSPPLATRCTPDPSNCHLKPSRPRLVPARSKVCTRHVREPLHLPQRMNSDAENRNLQSRRVRHHRLHWRHGTLPALHHSCLLNTEYLRRRLELAISPSAATRRSLATRCTLNIKPYTLHPTRSTSNRTPYSLHLQLQTLRTTLYTLNFNPYSLQPKP